MKKGSSQPSSPHKEPSQSRVTQDAFTKLPTSENVILNSIVGRSTSLRFEHKVLQKLNN